MKRIIAVAAALSALTLSAQEAGVTVTAKTGQDNSLIFQAEVNGYGTFTVQLEVDSIRNGRDEWTHTLLTTVLQNNGSTELLTIPPRDASVPVAATYRWDWLQGKLNAVPDLGFVYRLPIASGRSTKVRALTPSQAGMMRANTADFRMWEFSMEENDPVFAMRKGEVIFVEGYRENPPYPGGGAIIVEHADGTQARYNNLRQGSALVSAGDTVYPDTPIALAGRLPDGNYGVHVGLYRYATNRNRGAYPGMISQMDFINPLFMTRMGENILIDGETVTAKTTKRLLEAETGRKSFWQRVFGR